MKISTNSYEEIYEDYCCAMEWMESLGVDVSKGRVSQYSRFFEYWKGNYKDASEDRAKGDFPDFVSTVFEIYGFISIYKSFKEVPAIDLGSIITKLKKAVYGPEKAFDESSKSTEARNYLFEILLAAKAHRSSHDVQIIFEAKTDVGLAFSGYNFWFECKRISSISQIGKNIRKAKKQLKKHLSKTSGIRNRGVIALDLSKIINKGDKILVSKNNNELSRSVAKKTEQLVSEYSRVWQKILQDKSQNIIGVMIRVSYMAISEDRNLLVYVEEYGVNPRTGAKPNETRLLKALSDALSS